MCSRQIPQDAKEEVIMLITIDRRSKWSLVDPRDKDFLNKLLLDNSYEGIDILLCSAQDRRLHIHEWEVEWLVDDGATVSQSQLVAKLRSGFKQIYINERELAKYSDLPKGFSRQKVTGLFEHVSGGLNPVHYGRIEMRVLRLIFF